MRRLQRRLAGERPNLSETDFEDRLAGAGVRTDVAQKLRLALLPYCSADFCPHPDDELASAFAIDPEELEDMLSGLWAELGLPEPLASEPILVPQLRTVLDLALFLEDRAAKTSENGTAHMQKPPEIRRLA